VNLKGLVHRELSEGVTERELASVVGVSIRTIGDILADKLPEDPAIWETFARYFRIEADFLRAGGPPFPPGVFRLGESRHGASVGPMRKVPLLHSHQVDQMLKNDEPPGVVHAEAMLETDVPGKRTFAVMVKDDSMQPLFSKGELVFVNPDLPGQPGHYIVVDGDPRGALLRQLKHVGGQAVLHPLNSRYEDLLLTHRHRVWGRVVRLRKNL